MDIKQYLDSTYLKTPQQSGTTEVESVAIAARAINEAIEENFKLIMLRPDRVAIARQMIDDAHSNVLVGTVIDFPEGNRGLDYKLEEAKKAIANGTDELDFVTDYAAFIAGNADKVSFEIIACTRLAIHNSKTAKWIIEVAALTDEQIASICQLVQKAVTDNFDEKYFKNIFLKSSTGFYTTINGKPNGATVPSIRIMIANAGPLRVKAAGGVRNYNEALEMINMGVMRIGTSSAKAIADGQQALGTY